MIAVKVHEQEGIFVVSFNDHNLIDDEQIVQIADDLTEILTSASTGTRLVLDFQDVDRVSSSILHEVITLNKNALEKGVILQLCGLSPNVMRIFETTHLHQVLDILDDPPV